MDKSLLELLSKFMGLQNCQQSPNAQNPSLSSYPPEAFLHNHTQDHHNASAQSNPMLNMFSSLMSGCGGNPLSILTSLLGKKNPLANIMSTGNKKEEEHTSSPKDEILL